MMMTMSQSTIMEETAIALIAENNKLSAMQFSVLIAVIG